jgi:hypothetical protein
VPVYINTDIFSVADLLLTITQCIRCILRQLILGTLSLINPPNSANYTEVRNFGNFSRLREKRRRKKSVSISLLTSGAEGDFR